MKNDNKLTEQLLNHLWRNGSYGYFFHLPSHRTYWQNLLSGRVTCPIVDNQNAYFGVNPSSAIPPHNAKGNIDPLYIRGQCAYVAALNCLYAEYDCKDYGNSKAAILDHIATLAHSPSCLIDSGGGIHAYWLLRESLIIDTDDKRAFARNAQSHFATAMGGDEVKDLARVLRVPDSLNWKYAPARPVGFVGVDFSALYSIDELIAEIPEQKRAAQRSAKLVRRGVGPIGRFNRAIRIEQVLESYGYIQKGAKWLHPASSSGIAGVIIGDGINDEAHFNMCFSHNGSDPLCDGYWHDPFDALRLLEFGGNFYATLDAVKSREMR